MNRKKTLIIITATAIGIISAVIAGNIYSSSSNFSFFGIPQSLTEQIKSVDNNGNNNNVVIDMTTQQWKFLPISAGPNSDIVKLSSVPSPSGDAYADTTISVKKSATVTLRIQNLDVSHGFGLDEFGINKVTPAGEVTEIQFTADKGGTFVFYCTVFCGTGHPNHKGTLIVQA
ncbi:MAG: cupredoxin domain-containing protein [Nitrososphaeraceae archaeon]